MRKPRSPLSVVLLDSQGEGSAGEGGRVSPMAQLVAQVKF